ncbi:MAG: PilZ domain-containing protein [Acidobacteriota bacterium]
MEQRKKLRFELHLPYEIQPFGGRSRITGYTKNVGAEGVLFENSTLLSLGEKIEYYLTLPVGPGALGRVRVYCSGRVVRIDADECAATIETYEMVREIVASAAA